MWENERKNGDNWKSPVDEFLPFQVGADVAKYFVEVGKSLPNLFMRSNFRSERQRIAIVELTALCAKFNCKNGLALIGLDRASSDSVAAMRIERFLAGITAGATRSPVEKKEQSRGIFSLPKYTKQAGGDGNVASNG